MESGPFVIPPTSAGQSPLICELYSEHKLNNDVVNALEAKLKLILPQKTGNTVLIIGGKCGLTAELLTPFCSKIDIVEEEPYFSLLTQRFINNKDIQYTFNKQGDLGEEHVRPKPNLMGFSCKVNVYDMSKYESYDKAFKCYNVILLQNVLINQKINILEELLRIQHEVLITMLNPGKIVHENLFELLAGIEKNILTVFYEHILHQRLQNVKYMTGRKQQILFWEIFIWKKKHSSEEGSLHIVHEIKQILKKENEFNNIKRKQIETGMKSYETPELVEIYKGFHYNDEEYFTQKNFPKRCAEKAIAVCENHNVKGRALDIGCAVGRTSLEIATYFDEVVGVDLCHAFILAANQKLNSEYENLKNKVKFVEGDGCKLEKSLGKFSFIFAGNLIDRMYDPEEFLKQVAEFLDEKGILMLTSPYTWLEEFTPKNKWIGGYIKEGKPFTSIDGLSKILFSQGLKQIEQPEDMRFVMKENDWVFDYVLTNVTYWQKE